MKSTISLYAKTKFAPSNNNHHMKTFCRKKIWRRTHMKKKKKEPKPIEDLRGTHMKMKKEPKPSKNLDFLYRTRA